MKIPEWLKGRVAGKFSAEEMSKVAQLRFQKNKAALAEVGRVSNCIVSAEKVNRFRQGNPLLIGSKVFFYFESGSFSEVLKHPRHENMITNPLGAMLIRNPALIKENIPVILNICRKVRHHHSAARPQNP